jgi:hypothetical protein
MPPNSPFTIDHSRLQSGASIMQETQLIKVDSPRGYCEMHKIPCKYLEMKAKIRKFLASRCQRTGRN